MKTLGARVLDRLTRPPALPIFAVLQALLGLVVGLSYLASIEGPLGPAGRPVTGDFLGMYAAARLLDHGGALYDVAVQRAMQRELLGGELVTFQPYFYPPLLALALVPLSRLPYATAFVLYGAAVSALLVACTLYLLRALPRLGPPLTRTTAALLVLFFHPVLRTTLGGQTTGITLALWMASCGAAVRGRPLLAGALLGALGYKPQLLIVPLAWLLFQRKWRMLGATAGVLALHYALGAGALGVAWPLDYLRGLADYRGLERAASLPSHVALIPFADRLLGDPLGPALGLAASLAVIAVVLRALRTRSLDDPAAWSVVLCASLLCSPHLLYYDAGLAALPVLLSLQRAPDPTRPERVALIAGYVGYPAHTLTTQLGLQPLTPYLCWLLYWLLRRCRGTESPRVENG